MRVALLASTFVFLVATPAFAQCVYVACNGGVQAAPAYQQPAYQAPAYQASRSAPLNDYDEGYAAGIAARSQTPRHATHRHTARPVATKARTAAKTNHAARARANAGVYGSSRASNTGVTRRPAAVRVHAAPVAKKRAVVASRAAPARTHAPRRVVAARAVPRPTHRHTTYATSQYQDQIKDRAATYRSPVSGQSTTMASMMSRSGSYSATSTTWSGPASVVNQGGQVCGWGTRIVTNNHGYAQRQEMWVCQCPQGWRPPGY